MENMGNAILATEIFGLLVLIIIMCGLHFRTTDNADLKKSYMLLAMAVFAVIGLDAITYLPIAWNKISFIYYLLLWVTFVVPFLVYTLFLQYVYKHVLPATKLDNILYTVGYSLCGLGAFASLIFSVSGRLFSTKDDDYTIGQVHGGYMIMHLIVMIYATVIVCIDAKKLGKRDCTSALIFLMIPIFFSIVSMLNPNYSFCIPSFALSVLAVNTMIQAKREYNLIVNKEESSRLARNDELTGLLNRLAFTESCDLASGDGYAGVVFADVNGLKYANDNHGHKAGDKLLCDFRDILLSCFRKDDVYRVSGDEFVVLLIGMPKGVFDKKTEELVKKINEKDIPIASVGYAHGKEGQVQALIEKAESKMYIDKEHFHKKYPEYSRKSDNKE